MGYEGDKHGTAIFKSPAVLRKRIDAYFPYIDQQPARQVNVGKNVYTRKVPYTEEGFCAFLGVQKSDIKKLINDPGADAAVKRMVTDALIRIRAWLTEAALLGELDATVAKVVLASSLLSDGPAAAEIEAKEGMRIKLEGMTAEMVEKASR